MHPPTRGDEFDAGRATSIETCETTKNETCGKLAVAGFCQRCDNGGSRNTGRFPIKIIFLPSTTRPRRFNALINAHALKISTARRSVERELARAACMRCGNGRTNFASGFARNFEPIFESGNTRNNTIFVHIIRKYRGII